jgi:hypothetical protein
MDANDENTTDELKKVNKRIKKYTSRYARVRDQIGEEEWNRLVRLESLLSSLIWIFFSSVLLGIYYLFLRRLRFSPSFHLAPLDLVDELILISIPISFCALLMIRKLRNNALDSLEWHGQDPEKIESALLLEEEARSWKEAIPEITAEDQLLEAKAAGPSWWRVELSGLHLVLWIGVLLALSGLAKNSIIPEKLQITGLVVAIIGWLIKICCWIIWILRDGSAQTKLSLLRFYRSCGTWRGSATFIAILVLSVFLIGLICWLISLFFQ